MSERRKKPQIIACWKRCDNCQCFFFSTEQERHVEGCAMSAAVGTTLVKDLPGTIYQRIFHGCWENLKGKDNFLEDFIYLHPMTIQQLQMSFHGCLSKRAILLENEFIGYVKEDSNISPVNIGFSSDSWPASNTNTSVNSVRIEAISEKLFEAKEVYLEVQQKCNGSEDSTLLTVIHQHYENKLITVESILPVKWLFTSIHLRVAKIVSDIDEIIEAECSNAIKHIKYSTKHLSSSFVSISGKQKIFQVTSKTKFGWCERKALSVPRVSERYCGYEDIRERLGHLLDNTLRLDASSAGSRRGILLYGPTGCGKKFLIRAVVNQKKSVRLMEVSCSDIISAYLKGGGPAVESLFSAAGSSDLSVILLPHIDVVCLRSEKMKTEYSNISRSVISAIDRLLNNERNHTLLIATAYRRTDVDTELLTSNRLALDIEVKAPTPVDRLNILSSLLSGVPHHLSSDDIRSVSDDAHGFWAWHLVDLVHNARRRACLGESCSGVGASKNKTSTELVYIERQALLYGFAQTRKKLSSIAVKPVKWDDIGGRVDLKESLIEAIEAPNKQTEKYAEFGIERIKGILLYGPPGCSKTMIAKAIATQCSVNFFSVQGSELLSCFHGESERNIRDLFAQARHSAPSIIFFDEIDAIGGARGKSGNSVTGSMMQSLLAEMDGVDALTNVTIIAATNRPQSIDKALLRPGRLDRKIYVRLPDEQSRREILKIEFRQTKVDDEVHIEELVKRTEGFSCAEVVHLCNEARMAALREDIESATTLYLRHFEDAFTKITPGTDVKALEMYEHFEGKTRASIS